MVWHYCKKVPGLNPGSAEVSEKVMDQCMKHNCYCYIVIVLWEGVVHEQ